MLWNTACGPREGSALLLDEPEASMRGRIKNRTIMVGTCLSVIETTNRDRISAAVSATMTDDVATHLLIDNHNPPTLPVASIVRRLNRRVLPLCAVLLLLNGINHNNIAYGANEFCADLRLTTTQYGLGILCCYVGLTLIQPIANQFLKFLGGPLWFALNLLIWGAAGVGLGFIQKISQYYGLMFLSGMAQAGSYPGVYYYLSIFYPPRTLDSAFSNMIATSAFALPVTAGLSVLMVTLAEVIGWDSWRMILAGMGVLPILYSVVIYMTLPVSPETVRFLTLEEKEWIEIETGQDKIEEQSMTFIEELKHVMSNCQVQIAALAALCSFGVETVMMFFVNLIIRNALSPEDNHTDTCGTSSNHQMISIGLAAVPYICSGVACVLMGRYADRIQNRKCAAVILQLMSGILMTVWGPLNDLSFVTGFLALTVSIMLVFPPQVIVFSLATANTIPAARSTSMAYLNTVFSISGLVFPALIGALTDAYSYGWSIAGAGFLGIIAAVLVALLRDPLMDKEVCRTAAVNLESVR